jgi:uncharacterized membrane protein
MSFILSWKSNLSLAFMLIVFNGFSDCKTLAFLSNISIITSPIINYIINIITFLWAVENEYISLIDTISSNRHIIDTGMLITFHMEQLRCVILRDNPKS